MKRKKATEKTAALLLLLYYKARNTIDENIFRLCSIQALTILGLVDKNAAFVIIGD